MSTINLAVGTIVDHRVDATARVTQPARLLRLIPHMHVRAKAFEVRLIAGEKTTAPLRVPKYDFRWQNAYSLEEPVLLKGDKIECTAWYDNSKNNPFNPDADAEVRSGDQTWEEMMLNYIDIAVPIDVERKRRDRTLFPSTLRRLARCAGFIWTPAMSPARFAYLVYTGRYTMRLSGQLRASVGLWCLAAVAITGCVHPKQAVSQTDRQETAPTPDSKRNSDLVLLKADAPELRHMKVEPVKTFPLPAEEVTSPARIEINPNRVAHAILPAPGRVVQVVVKLGDTVKAGQPVVTIDSSVVAETQASLLQAESAVRQAELALAKAETDLVRLTDLFEHQAVARKDVLAAQTATSLARAAVQQARSARDQAKTHVQYLGLEPSHFDQTVTVTAPISGKVLELNVVSGEFRNEINTPLITIADLSRVWATSEVPESQIRFCRIGGAATLALIAYPGEEFRARVTRIADTLNSETRTVKVTAELDNAAGRLRPEMFGQLRYASATLNTAWVPENAVVRIGDKDYVFLEESTGRFRSTPVSLGKRYQQGYTLLNGVSAGQRIVTQGSIYLKAAL